MKFKDDILVILFAFLTLILYKFLWLAPFAVSLILGIILDGGIKRAAIVGLKLSFSIIIFLFLIAICSKLITSLILTSIFPYLIMLLTIPFLVLLPKLLLLSLLCIVGCIIGSCLVT